MYGICNMLWDGREERFGIHKIYYGMFRGGNKRRERDKGIALGNLGRNKHG